MQRDKGWLECAEKLERLRDELHSALRSAAFSFSSMQKLEEDRGCLICMDSMPSYSGSLVPTVYLSSTESTVASDCNDGVNSPTSTAHETIRRWQVTTSSCIGESDSMVAETSLHDDDCVAKHNVLHYFRSCPSKEMMECQTLYQLVISHALGVVQAQCDLWEAAGVVDATNAAA